MRRVETAIAFAGEEWAILMRFLGAEVMAVSMVAVEGRAVVMVVSRWPISVVVAVLLVSKSARGCVLCAKKFALLGPVRTRARKSSPSTRKMAQNGYLMARWANFVAQQGRCLSCWANVVAPLASPACSATIGEPCQARRPPTAARPKQTARYCHKRTARPRIMRGRAAIRRIKRQRPTQSLHTALRLRAAHAPRAHFFSSVTRYTLVSRSWKPARW